MNLGWIGTGNMGARMAERLVKAGYKLNVYNRTKEKADRVLAAGDAVFMDTSEKIAENSDIIFTSVTNDAAMREVLEGEHGLLKAARPGQIIVEMSTFGPDFCDGLREKLHARGMLYLDAPVIGSMFMIEAGLLKILASGDREAYDAALPCFNAIGKTSVYMGDGAKARFMKIAVNMMICSYLTVYGEILSAGEGMGFAWEELNNLLEECAGASPMLSDKGTLHRQRVWGSETALTSTAMKDLHLALECAEKAGIAMPVTAMVLQYDNFMHFNPKYSSFSTFGTIGVLEDITGVKPAKEPGDFEGKKDCTKALEAALIGATALIAGEAALLCRAADIEESLALDCLKTCHGASKYIKNSGDGFKLSLKAVKDGVNAVLKASKEAGLFTPALAAAGQQLSVLCAQRGENAQLLAVLAD